MKVPYSIETELVRLDEAETDLVHMDGLVYWNFRERNLVTEEDGLGESGWIYVLKETETGELVKAFGRTLVNRTYLITNKQV